MNKPLKPCPFCGSKANYETFHDGFTRWHRIKCPFCKVVMDRDTNHEVVIAAWNKRTEKASDG